MAGPLPWRTAVSIGVGWIALNVGLYTVLTCSDDSQPELDDDEIQLSDRVAEAFHEERLVVRAEGNHTSSLIVRYRLMKPDALTAGQTYPVILFLHGAGQRGNDNRRELAGLPEQMAERSWRDDYSCFLIAPQCPAGQTWSDQMNVAVAILTEVIDAHSVDEGRIYLAGLSMGGYGTWGLAASHPELFAAIVPICGGGDPRAAECLAGVPIWAVHGSEDDAVPVEQSRIMIEAIRQAGGHPLHTELQGVGHDCWTASYSDPDGVIPWMFRQFKSRQ